jgi:hypothetical protein
VPTSEDAKSMTLEERLEIWIVARCHEQNLRPQRVAELNAIFRDVYTDPRFWKYQNNRNRDYYEDALILMWRYFMRNLCKATTARKRGSFLETCTYAVGRLLNNLEGNLQNIEKQMRADMAIQVQPIINNNGDVVDPVEQLPNPEPVVASHQFELFLKLLEDDPMGELNHKENTLFGQTKTTKEPYVYCFIENKKRFNRLLMNEIFLVGRCRAVQSQQSGKRWRASMLKWL